MKREAIYPKRKSRFPQPLYVCLPGSSLRSPLPGCSVPVRSAQDQSFQLFLPVELIGEHYRGFAGGKRANQDEGQFGGAHVTLNVAARFRIDKMNETVIRNCGVCLTPSPHKRGSSILHLPLAPLEKKGLEEIH